MRFAPTRRDFVAGAGALGIATALTKPAGAAPTGASHGMSSFGELKYPADFPHFAYVNPAAPRGGRFSAQLSATLGNQAGDTFNTLNIYVLRGDGAAGMNLTFDSLMVRALDEPDSLYGLVARSVEASEDGLTYRFTLRPQARFHDGTRLTAADVAFSLNLLKEKGHPEISQVIRDMADAVAESGETLIVRFEKGRSRDLLLFVATLPIFSKAYYTGRDFEVSTLEPPMGSGPYKVGRLEAGRFIELGAGGRLLGRRPTGDDRAEQFRADPLRVFPRSSGGVRGLQERHLHLPRGVHRPRLGDGLRFPRLPRGSCPQRGRARCADPPARRAGGSILAAKPSRIAGSARRSACVSTSPGRTRT